jgi:hypothetical protein
MKKTNEYDAQAEKFLRDTGTKLTLKCVGYRPYFSDEKESRDVYKFTIKTARGQYTGTFGQSIACQGEEPRAYDILSCIGADAYSPDTFEDFCAEFGYDTDSRKAEKIFHTVQKEVAGLRRIFTDKQIEQLSAIQ